GRASGIEKVQRVSEHFHTLAENVPYLQANFIFGLDTDQGDAPIELTKLFMDRTPFVWPAINIPMPFGGTPLHGDLVSDGRVLASMPFAFYYAPYPVTIPRHYDPVTYYGKLLELFTHATSRSMLARRMRSTSSRKVQLIHWTRTAGTRATMGRYRQILQLLRTDAGFRAFHEGRTTALPEFYHHQYDRMLGRYAPLLSRTDRTPVLT